MILSGIFLNLLIGVGTLTGLWFIYLWKRNPSVVDLGWAIGLTLMGLIHNLRGDTVSSGSLLAGFGLENGTPVMNHFSKSRRSLHLSFF